MDGYVVCLGSRLVHIRRIIEALRLILIFADHWPCTCIEICTVLNHQKCIICIELLSVVLKATTCHCDRHRDHRHQHQLCTC